MKINFIAWFLLLLVLPLTGYSQELPTDELHFEVNRIYPPLSFTKEELNEAKTLVDLNPYFKPSWIREYVSVEIEAFHQGRTRKKVNNTASLSKDQINLIKMADTGSMGGETTGGQGCEGMADCIKKTDSTQLAMACGDSRLLAF